MIKAKKKVILEIMNNDVVEEQSVDKNVLPQGDDWHIV